MSGSLEMPSTAAAGAARAAGLGGAEHGSPGESCVQEVGGQSEEDGHSWRRPSAATPGLLRECPEWEAHVRGGRLERGNVV